MKITTRILLTFAIGLFLIFGVQIAFKTGFTSSLGFTSSILSGSSISTPSLTIDATLTPTSSSAGVVDVDLTTSGANVSGENITMNIAGDYAGYGTKTTINSTANLSGSTIQVGNAIYINGRSTGASSTGAYIGNGIYNGTSTANNSSYIGNRVMFSADSGGVNFTGGGDVTAYDGNIALSGTGGGTSFSGTLSKTSAGGTLNGLDIAVNNASGGAVDYLFGLNVKVNVAASPTESTGIYLFEDEQPGQVAPYGTLQRGIWVGASRNTGTAPYAITTAIDVSDADIDNAINLGANNIIATDSFSIDINNAADKNLSITNSAAGLTSILLEGGLTIGNNGANPGTKITKHLSATTAWDPADIATAASTSTTVNISGAALGDTVAVGLSTNTTAGMILTGSVTSSGVVTVTLGNLSGGNVNIPNGTLRVDVWQH